MSKEKVLTHLEDVIRIASREIKREKVAKSDQMRQLAGLTNAYTRLLYKSEEMDGAEIENAKNGQAGYYEKMIGNQP